ncbi:MAG: ShlB/FhaC/HecB family hemolysin secretion/activation protein [Planctomycetota bacterium]
MCSKARVMCLCMLRLYCISFVLFAYSGSIGYCSVLDSRSARFKAEEEKAAVKQPKTDLVPELAEPNLPEDTSTRFNVRKISISGNTLISNDELLENLPVVYNASDKPIEEAESGDLYDFGAIHEVLSNPDLPNELSRRTMQGLTQYILSVYQDNGFAGIYVYIAAQAVQDGTQLKGEVLPIEIVEAHVLDVNVTSFDLERQEVEKGILRSSLVKAWSPVKQGQVVNKRNLDKYVNLLNLNPDRYVSPVISRGSEPNTLALNYEVYEGNPWHYWIQVDNSGTDQRQWAPKTGFVNTNLTGNDDKLMALVQAPWERGIEEDFLLFGSYGFPVLTPALRANIWGGHSEFATTGDIGVNFLGTGSFYGLNLTLNVLQINNWFIDLTGSLSHEESEVKASEFAAALDTNVDMGLWAIGFSVHRSDEVSSTSLTLSRTENMDTSSRASFEQARPSGGNISTDFRIYSASASHSQLLDSDKSQRLSGSIRYIDSSGRLVPSKMTTFGGLYSVRGYKEDEIVADGGLLFSAQYEFDLVKYWQSRQDDQDQSDKQQENNECITKLAPLVFYDLARARIKDPVPGEKSVRELYSVGTGLLISLRNNFDAGMYYGWPLKSTERTDRCDGRFNFTFTLRF